MYAGWQADQDAAEEKYRIVGAWENGFPMQHDEKTVDWNVPEWPLRQSRQVEAEAGTGSRYVVVVTRLGAGGAREGGPMLVSVVWPWQDCKVMQADGWLDQSYVAEHLTDGRASERRLHGGDLWALTQTIRIALRRVDG